MAKKSAAVVVPEPEPEPVNLIEMQQQYYEFFGFRSHIFYDLYPTLSTLERKLRLLVSEELTRPLADVIWAQRVNVGTPNAFGVRMSPIFVFCAYDQDIMRAKLTFPLTMVSNKFSFHPVFRVQKCTKEKSDARDCCSIFVDELGRVYQHWQDFVENNKFDNCVMLAPQNGIYVGDAKCNEVILNVFLRNSGVTELLDVGTVITSVIAAGVTLVAAIPAITIAPVVIGTAAIAGVSGAVYSGIRSTYQLYDRYSHKQAIGLENKESRGAWLNITTGALAAGTAGAAQTLSKMAQRGKDVSRGILYTVKGAQYGTFGIQTIGCGEGIYAIGKKLHNGESITTGEIAQLSSMLFLWTHSAKNLNLGESVMKISETKNTMATKRFLLSTQKTVNSLVNVHKTIMDRLVNPQMMINVVKECPEMIMEGVAYIRQIGVSYSQPNCEFKYGTGGDMLATTKIEYCRVFDTRMEAIVSTINRKYKCNDITVVKKLLIKYMSSAYNLTLKGVDNLINYALRTFKNLVHEVGLKSEELDRLLAHIFHLIKQRVKITPMSVNKYLEALNRGNELYRYEIRHMDADVRQMIEDGTNSVADMDIDDINAPEDDIVNEDKKLELALKDRAEDIMIRFSEFENKDRTTVLEETIGSIIIDLTCDSADVFFNIVERLVRKHNESIQETLALDESIPIDNFITVIYFLLLMRSESTSMEILLAEYNEDMHAEIDEEFRAIYQTVTTADKIVDCKKCAGKTCSQ